jgi:hypothetical protein
MGVTKEKGGQFSEAEFPFREYLVTGIKADSFHKFFVVDSSCIYY